MKKFLCSLFMFALGCAAFASGQAEDLNYVVGSLNIIDLPFPIQNCRVGNPALIGVEVISNNTKLRIISNQTGVTDLQVMGDNMTKLYRITVVSNMQEMLRNLTSDLDNIPEVEAVVSGNKITLKGEISNIVHWEMLQKLLPFYSGNVVNLVTFQPKAEVMLLLQKSLTKAGYTVVKEGSELSHGELAVVPMGDTLTITGTVYSPEDIKRIEGILNAQSWLSTKDDANKKRIRAVMNVEIVPEMLEIGAVYVGIEQSQIEQIGNNFMKAGIPLDLFASYNGSIGRNFGPHRGGGSYGISSNIGTVIRLLGENTNTVFRHAGFLTFKSNDTPVFRELHNGGTLKVRLNGENSGSLSDVDYGFILRIKGGLTGKDKVFMEIEVTISTPILLENGDYDVKTKTVKTTAFCKLDETLALGGLKELLDDATGPNGLPYLRNIPLVQWFVAEKGNHYSDKQTLLLVSPRLMSKAKPIEIPPAQELRDVEEAAQIKLRQGKKEQRRWYEYLRW